VWLNARAVAAETLPATGVLATDRVRAFRDIDPRQAPTHVLGGRSLTGPPG
jgi:hypothetical protein